MKEYTIIGAERMETSPTLHKMGRDLVITGDDDMSVSDRYHTMDELYEHRYALFRALCKAENEADEVMAAASGVHFSVFKYKRVWRSKQHHTDAEGKSMAMFDVMFIAGIGKEKGHQISYHLPIELWDSFDFADTLEEAPEWDGHSSNDVIERLKAL